MPFYLFVIFWLHWYRDWTGLLHLSRIPLSTRLLESSGFSKLKRYWYILSCLLLRSLPRQTNFDHIVVVLGYGFPFQRRLRQRRWWLKLWWAWLLENYWLRFHLLFSIERFHCSLRISFNNPDGLLERLYYECGKAISKLLALRPGVHFPTWMMLSGWLFSYFIIIIDNLDSLQRLEHVDYCGRIFWGWG